MPPPSSPGSTDMRNSQLRFNEELRSMRGLNTINILSSLLLSDTYETNVPGNRNGRVWDDELHAWIDHLSEFDDVLDSDYQGYSTDEPLDDTTSLDSENLASDIQSHERLLLSSARQNPTNMNAIISGNNNTSLARSNAIIDRHRNKLCKNWDMDLEFRSKVASQLYAQVSALWKIFRHLKLESDTVSLFKCHHCHREENEYNIAKDSLLSNLESTMDDFLQKRKTGKLWSEERPEKPLSRCPHKRKLSNTTSKKNKRQRLSALGSEEDCTSISPSNFDINNLTYERKYSIMDIPYSSFLRPGASFSLGSSLKPEDTNGLPMDLIFSLVDYKNAILEGGFSVAPKTSKQEPMTLVSQFLDSHNCYQDFFLGTIKDGRKETNLQIKLLRKLDLEIQEMGEFRRPVRPFTVPFSGRIVDFKHNDLRFLSNAKVFNNVRSRNFHLARAKSARVRYQLLEWMKIQPFNRFEEYFFKTHLKLLRRKLRMKTFQCLTDGEQKEVLEFADGMCCNIFQLSKHLDFLRRGNLEFSLLERQKKNSETSIVHDKSCFLHEKWESKLVRKLSEFFTCQSTCLLHTQTNYIFFTLLIDTEEYLEKCILYKLNLLPKEKKERYLNEFEQIRHAASMCNPKIILLCSLNRKEGTIEIKNTSRFLGVHTADRSTHYSADDYEETSNSPHVIDASGSDSPSSDTFIPDRHVESYVKSKNKECEILRGHYKKSNGTNNSLGGGTLTASIV